ncbi:hypothetical protein CDL15_Pgr024027 [Punica granatum]|uniref:Uncharacterized protein n=1 Tax=Punica granatum TaxID=22663 RepID=A0A218XQ79_PUNGR|nr:hypothetical protein CDL15_Pgr024027 [Punica granatum]
MGLQAPRDHQGHGTSFRRPFETLRGSPRDVSVVANDLRGTITENRDHCDSRTPQDVQGTLRKPQSKVPRSSRANGLRPGTRSQRSPRGRRVTETNVKTHKEQSGTGGH